jgi:hypothetical protein
MEVTTAMGTGIITRDFFLKFYLFMAKGASYHGVPSLNVGLETKLIQVDELSSLRSQLECWSNGTLE